MRGIGGAVRFGSIAAAAVLALSLAGCAAGRLPDLAAPQGVGLRPCPSSPNCVSSRGPDADHSVRPFHLAPRATLADLAEVVAALPRTTIVAHMPEYLHAECRSVVFGFVDDLELLPDPDEPTRVDVRSASRVGYSDLGVNRRRVARLRELLTAAGLVTGE